MHIRPAIYSTRDVKCGIRHDAKVPFLIQGFPAAEVSATEGGVEGVEPLSLGSLRARGSKL